MIKWSGLKSFSGFVFAKASAEGEGRWSAGKGTGRAQGGGEPCGAVRVAGPASVLYRACGCTDLTLRHWGYIFTHTGLKMSAINTPLTNLWHTLLFFKIISERFREKFCFLPTFPIMKYEFWNLIILIPNMCIKFPSTPSLLLLRHFSFRVCVGVCVYEYV